MNTPIGKARGEGNCVEATRRGEEACECVVKLTGTVVVSRILTSVARLRTETPYQAGAVRRAGTTLRSRSRSTTQVNGELARRQTTFLSGEICSDGSRAVVAPGSKACLKAWNGSAQAQPGGAEVSRGRSTETRIPIETGRTKR